MRAADGTEITVLDEPVVRGGESEVYAALGPDGERLAVKRASLPAPLGAWIDNERARLEAAAADPRLRPWVVAVRYHGRWGERPFYAMDWYPDTLATRVPTATPEVRTKLAVALCRAVQALHRARVVHSDIKPTNVLIRGDRLCLADFGAARAGPEVATTVGVGTPGYAPPEQRPGVPRRPSVQDDVYALAATLCFVLTGHPPEAPLGGVGLTANDRKRLARAGVGPRAERALAAALAPRPADRRGSAARLARVLVHPQRVGIPPRASVAALLLLAGDPRPAPPVYDAVPIGEIWFGVTEVDQATWTALTGEVLADRRALRSGSLGDPCASASGYSLIGPALPMTCISYYDAVRFANALSRAQGLPEAYTVRLQDDGVSVRWDRTSSGWRLPTAAEWTTVARGGLAGTWPQLRSEEVCRCTNLADASVTQNFARTYHCDDGYAGPAPVGSLLPNSLGVRHLEGNVSEWVWQDSESSGAPFRGWSWADGPPPTADTPSTLDSTLPATDRHPMVGLRLVRDRR